VSFDDPQNRAVSNRNTGGTSHVTARKFLQEAKGRDGSGGGDEDPSVRSRDRAPMGSGGAAGFAKPKTLRKTIEMYAVVTALNTLLNHLSRYLSHYLHTKNRIGTHSHIAQEGLDSPAKQLLQCSYEATPLFSRRSIFGLCCNIGSSIVRLSSKISKVRDSNSIVSHRTAVKCCQMYRHGSGNM